jgi:hypothetical protein
MNYDMDTDKIRELKIENLNYRIKNLEGKKINFTSWVYLMILAILIAGASWYKVYSIKDEYWQLYAHDAEPIGSYEECGQSGTGPAISGDCYEVREYSEEDEMIIALREELIFPYTAVRLFGFLGILVCGYFLYVRKREDIEINDCKREINMLQNDAMI